MSAETRVKRHPFNLDHTLVTSHKIPTWTREQLALLSRLKVNYDIVLSKYSGYVVKRYDALCTTNTEDVRELLT